MLAATQCDQYQKHIIPLINVLDAAIEKHEIILFKKAEIDIKDGDIRVRHKLSKEEFSTEIKKIASIVKETVAVYNALEAFAVFFIAGVADEKIAFSSVGETYCWSVRKYLPDIVLLTGYGNYYKNMISLFLLWNSRLERQALLKAKNKIEDRIQSVSNKFITPVGTN
jgi:hypothetical protein